MNEAAAVTPILEDDAEDIAQTPLASKTKLETETSKIKIINQAEQPIDSQNNSRQLLDQDTALQTQVSH